ncbi:hypothetical protein [Nostoc sp.]
MRKMSFNADGKQIIFVSNDMVKLWNLPGEKLNGFKVPKNQ